MTASSSQGTVASGVGATPILSAADVRVEFAGRGRRRGVATAVDGVNLDIAPGEIVALVGESGCGKTTLARTMLGLERPTSGQVRFSGQPLSYRSGALRGYRRSVQLVLQDPTGSLNPRHTVYEAIAEGVRIHRLDNEEARVADALARCGMRPPKRFFQRYPHELSGGQRQRVVIAGALVLEPIVLAGEPPDPTRIPSGCRFHPRCPELASGAAAAAVVADRCTGVTLPVL